MTTAIHEEYHRVVFPEGIGEPEDQQIHKPDMHFLVDFLHVAQPRNVLEIGACQGTSSRTFGKYLKDNGGGGVVVSIEPNPTEVYLRQRRDMGLQDSMVLVEASSPCAGYVRSVMCHLGIGHFDLLFIDGLHQFVNVLVDFYCNLPFIRPDGWVAFHDTKHMPEVKGAVRKLEELGFIERHSDSESTAGLTAYRLLSRKGISGG
jgi:predicted O-methyltransferase YrrM